MSETAGNRRDAINAKPNQSSSHPSTMSAATTLPDTNALLKASELNVFDSKGKEIKFGTIFEKEKVIVVFIRMFNGVVSSVVNS